MLKVNSVTALTSAMRAHDLSFPVEVAVFNGSSPVRLEPETGALVKPGHYQMKLIPSLDAAVRVIGNMDQINLLTAAPEGAGLVLVLDVIEGSAENEFGQLTIAQGLGPDPFQPVGGGEVAAAAGSNAPVAAVDPSTPSFRVQDEPTPAPKPEPPKAEDTPKAAAPDAAPAARAGRQRNT